MEPVLILGGSCQAGSGAAALLRRWHPTLPLAIAGRDLGRAQRVADELGAATALTVDLRRRDLGLPAGAGFSAVVVALWDDHLHGLRHARRHGVPYLSVSNGLVDVVPEVVAGAQRPGAAPVLVASHCFAGTVVLAALHVAREFGRVDGIHVGVVLDESDAGGPAGLADLERLATATSAGLVRRDGVFTWVAAEDAQVEVPTLDGTVLTGQSAAVLDVPSLALATDAPNVGFAFAAGESAGRRRGGPTSVEVRIDVDGADRAGAPLRVSRYLVHPAGQRPLTALGIALGAERLLGLRGDPVAPGIHMPEALLDPAFVAERLAEVGATFVEAPVGTMVAGSPA